MCAGKPKAPKVPKVPDRMASVLPDGGDPAMRAMNRNRRRLMPSAMIFTNQGTLGAPSTASPSGGGY